MINKLNSQLEELFEDQSIPLSDRAREIIVAFIEKDRKQQEARILSEVVREFNKDKYEKN